MTLIDILNEHKSELRDYRQFFLSKPDGMTVGEISYYILENSAMLYRYTNDESYINEIKESNFKLLVNSAAKYVSGMTINQQVIELCSLDDFCDSDMYDAELLIQARDGLEMVRMIVSVLIKPFVYAGDFSLMDDLTTIKKYRDQFDNLIQGDLSLLTVASREIYSLKKHIKIELSSEFWWFDEAHELDLKLTAQEKSLVENFATHSAILGERRNSSRVAGEEQDVPVNIIAFKVPIRTALDNFLNEPNDFISAAASSNESSLGELHSKFEGEYKGFSFSIRCYKKPDNTVNIEVVGDDGNKIDFLEKTLCRFQNDEVQVSSCVINNGVGNCKVSEEFNNISLQLAK